MNTSIKILISTILTGVMVYSGIYVDRSIHKEEVKAAILDYVEGVYEADTSKIHRSVHPDLVKRGSYFNREQASYSEFREMNFDQLLELTKSWNKDGKRANSRSLKEITVFDVQDKTASGKLSAVWGTDYFHLAKINGKWFIMNVLWQSHQPNQPALKVKGHA